MISKLDMFVFDRLAQGLAARSVGNRAITDLLAWSRHYLAEHFWLPPSAMHRWISERASSRQRSQRIVIQGPRGNAKSTLLSLALALRSAVEAWDPYIWLVADTLPQARLQLQNIRHELETNERLMDDYPEATGQGKIWQQTRVLTRSGVLIEALGTGQRLRGRRFRTARPSLIIVDDPEDEDRVLQPDRREKTRRWFHGALEPAGTPATSIVVIGTNIHRECLVEHLRRLGTWSSKVFRSVIEWPDRMDLWAEWESILVDQSVDDVERASNAKEFYLARRDVMDAGAEVLWPDLEDLYSLMTMRASGHTAFEAEKQNRPVSPDTLEWPPEYFSGADLWFDVWPDPNERIVRIVALDPSKGRDARRGDYSAIIRLCFAQNGLLYVDADLQRRPVPKLIRDTIAAVIEFSPDAFGIETNQFQELLVTEFDRQAVELGVLLPIVQMENTVAKVVRIRRLGPYLAQRKIRFRRRSAGAMMLLEQLQDFPQGVHDDGPDALEMAVRLATEHAMAPVGVPDGWDEIQDRGPMP